MGNATRVTVSTFGAVAGLAGLEHGIGETLQGNVAPDGMAILFSAFGVLLLTIFTGLAHDSQRQTGFQDTLSVAQLLKS